MLKKADVEFKILKVPDDVLEEVVAQGISQSSKIDKPVWKIQYF